MQPYWSRLDYMMSQMGAPMPSIREFRATLPAAARSLYYRDEIGNISTSHARFGLANAEVELRPRYPLFGGWKVSWPVGPWHLHIPDSRLPHAGHGPNSCARGSS